MNLNGPVVVLGATGKTGRRVADIAERRGIDVRRASRNSAHPFAWEDPGTWAQALAGASALYVTYFPDLAAPGAPAVLDELGKHASAHGITSAVLLSGRGEPASAEAESAFTAHLPDTVVIRCAWFDQNFTEGLLADAVAQGGYSLPAPESASEPFVDADDVAEVVVTLLHHSAHAGASYELTGPELVDMGQAAATLSGATGREVGYRASSIEQFAETLSGAGVELEEALSLGHALAETLDGRNRQISDHIAQLLGRPPRSFAEFAMEAATSGLFGVPTKP
jgi:uncharacterized protein YbjT (DUF2867 family)